MNELDRYSRQRRLPEVGDLGQARIERTSATICGREGATTELVYLERAGVPVDALYPRMPCEPFPHAEWFRFARTREFASGAWRALRTLRRALEQETP